eukprot:TRINITY_DN72452_c0_g1_i1.p1 TRINITY_DN72452_c0_g1~~TRINITY_DN72452_c0_g1_i1.p1  ORF type:complete len:376 (+),score=39.65 TRINITY_DN72452_c0_g1_i1:32-1129(+)
MALNRIHVGFMIIVVVAAWSVYKLDFFWCEARSVPLGTFWRSPGFSLKDMPDLSGRVALVTGASDGLGYEVALQLAIANATVILACRDAKKCLRAAEQIRLSAHHNERVRCVELDLANLQQVDACARSLLQELSVLDILVNNAGIATRFPHTVTSDGFEVTFQVNYLGHFLLTTRLLPLLTSPSLVSPARIVHLSSGAHRGAPPEGVPLVKAAINDPAGIGAYARYGMAKLANLVFARELGRREPRVLSTAVHPGVVATQMLRRSNFDAMLGTYVGGVVFRLARLRNLIFAYSCRAAALTVLYCAASPDIDRFQTQGAFFVPVATAWSPRHPAAEDVAFGERLWNFSERAVSEALEDRMDAASAG